MFDSKGGWEENLVRCEGWQVGRVVGRTVRRVNGSLGTFRRGGNLSS